MKKLLFVFCFLVSASVHAKWIQVSDRAWFDPDGATKTGSVVTFWGLFNIDPAKAPDPRIASQKIRSNIDCAKKFETIDWIVMYDKPMGKGKVLFNQAVDMPGQPIPPDTIVAEQMAYLCK